MTLLCSTSGFHLEEQTNQQQQHKINNLRLSHTFHFFLSPKKTNEKILSKENQISSERVIFPSSTFLLLLSLAREREEVGNVRNEELALTVLWGASEGGLPKPKVPGRRGEKKKNSTSALFLMQRCAEVRGGKREGRREG